MSLEHARIGLLVCFALTMPSVGLAEQHVKKNVVYGMLSGLALTMDVYSGENSNGRGVVLIPGSAWDGRSIHYTEWEVKSGYPYINRVRNALVSEGFAVFVPNHRMAPVHRFPSAVDDVRRAVRFIRHNASEFGIDPERLGAVGHSSGAYLCALLGVLEDNITEADDTYPLGRYSSRVQAVVSIAAPYDLSKPSPSLMPFVVAFMGERPPMDPQWKDYVLEGRYAEASPITHVSRDDAAFMLVYASGDPMIAPRQAEAMTAALLDAQLKAETVLLPDTTHTPELDLNRALRWLQRQLE